MSFCCWYSFLVWCDFVVCVFVVVCIYLIFGAMLVVFWSCGFTNQQMIVVCVCGSGCCCSWCCVFAWRESSELYSRKLEMFFVGGFYPKKTSPLRFKKKWRTKKTPKTNKSSPKFQKKLLIESFGNTKFLKHAWLHPLPPPPQSLSTTWKSNCTKTSRCLR